MLFYLQQYIYIYIKKLFCSTACTFHNYKEMASNALNLTRNFEVGLKCIFLFNVLK